MTVRNPRAITAPTSATAVRHGLVGMTERVTASGGTITVGPQGHDWVVDAWLPADTSERAATETPTTSFPQRHASDTP